MTTTVGLRAADPVFSGPQPGERTTPFKVIELTGEGANRERDPVTENAGAATALVFVYGVERSLAPLLRAVDDYGASNRSRLKTELVFLAADRLTGEARVKAAAGSLRLRSRIGLSPDGVGGPGNYGLSKDCLLTLVAAQGNVVVTNFALVQPGIADAPAVFAALAKLCGDTNPPTAEVLLARANPGRNERMGMARPAGETPPREPFPGAVPTDERLQSLLRRLYLRTLSRPPSAPEFGAWTTELASAGDRPHAGDLLHSHLAGRRAQPPGHLRSQAGRPPPSSTPASAASWLTAQRRGRCRDMLQTGLGP